MPTLTTGLFSAA